MKKALKQQMFKGQRLIAEAEFEYGVKPATITREQFDAKVNLGNTMILAALDGELIPVQNESEAK